MGAIATTWWNRLWWSAVNDPEDFSAVDAGFREISNSYGAITGLATLGDLFFVFQEQGYNVYQYVVGDDPLVWVKDWPYGCNFFKTIVPYQGSLLYLSSNGEIRRTNGFNDESISSRIKPLCNDITNARTVKDYYTTAADSTPNAFYDQKNNAYRLFYSGSSDKNDKCLSYFFDRDIFTTGSGMYYAATHPVYGYTAYVAITGTANADGQANYLLADYSSLALTGTLDLGWIVAGDPTKKIRINTVDIWVHPQAGESAASDCAATLTLSIYDQIGTPATATVTNSTTIAYSAADSLDRITLEVQMEGEMLRLVLTDSGSYRNYSIEKIAVDYEEVDIDN